MVALPTRTGALPIMNKKAKLIPLMTAVRVAVIEDVQFFIKLSL